MIKNAIILHGKPSKQGYYNPEGLSESNKHWIPWLQHELIIRDILTQTPELPRAYEPNYQDWKQVFEAYDITSDTLLVGHSCGAGFLVRWLSEHKEAKVNKVVLVAPSLALDWEDTQNFFQFEIDPNIVTRTTGITMFVAQDDKPGIIEASKRLRQIVKGVGLREFSTGGHFTYSDMKTDRFPELLEELLR